MEFTFMEDDNGDELFDLAKDYFKDGDHIKALEVLEDLSLDQGNDDPVEGIHVNYFQGTIFRELAGDSENNDVKVTYLLASVECYSRNLGLSAFSAGTLFLLAQQIESVLYYKQSVRKAKEGLYKAVSMQEGESVNKEREELMSIIEHAELRIAESKTRVDSPVENCEQQVRESKENGETRKSEPDLFKRLRSYWAGLNVEIKRNFMKVSTAELRSYVEGIYSTGGRDALEQVLTSAKEDRKWRFWFCRTCSVKFSSPEECKSHFEQQHGAEFKPSSAKDITKRISKVWTRKILVGGWDPVDAVAAIQLIKNRLEDVKAFAYENGWSKDWPLAADKERSELLKEIQSLLVSFCDHKILSCSVRDWVMHFLVQHLENLEVSKHILTDCRLVETPQSICFLECGELNQILDFLKNIKCERDDGTDLVCRAVDSFYAGTRVKEKIDFDPQFSFLLLDKRLLQCKIARFDDEGIINVFDHNVHYAKAHAQGDDILSWLFDKSSQDESIPFPTPIRAHNLDIWIAVLRAVQFTCRTLGTKYAKKLQYLDYDAALTGAKNLCISEDVKRKNLHKDHWNSYASLLCKRCKERDAGDSLTTKAFLCVVRDVLKGASYPTLDFPDLEDYLTVIHGSTNLSDELVLKSLDLLKFVVNLLVPLIDSKILLIENSRINLLNGLIRLSVFDYRSYIGQPMKEVMLDRILDMESKVKAAATEEDISLEKEADILFEKEAEEEKKLQSKKKKKKNKSNKRTSPSLSSAFNENKTVEHESSVNLEPGVTSPLLKTAEEDSMEPEDTFSSESGQTSLNTINQEDATKDMENMPGEDSFSEHLEFAHGEAANRYRSALDMTLKALLNIKALEKDLVYNRQPFHGNLEEQVPYALQDFFSAFVSEQITEKGLYNYLLRNIFASLEEIHSMSSDAAGVVVAILEFCHFWKSPERESLVTRLFTLEEYERMSCRKCRRKPNYPEQSSYGIVMAADSIVDLKCALGNIKFEDVLKVIRMEGEMMCDVKTGGCGTTNFVHHTISRCPPIFTIVLEWEKNETEKEISETTNALHWEIDISMLYEGLEPNTNYRLVSMNMEMQIGCVEEGEFICMAYTKNRWVSLRHETLAEEVVGNWKSVVRFCGERKLRPEILFYEATRSMA
ncbi:uncharacterized protein LOC9322891 isoform X1 [Arabidopsis lyrata subsp. lyrata]|uniref:uncharacterized protein LOC9322891 isoform X1 n=1 Tax=Arabidopsis lyrata subsp. lyrata TaxID=81972 RepID=UPI000A29E894|nr:uncharacterized protein LOC9322891 isoform X1 [Arabidopsis lyrata subsp. lyrata]|eukprot:XP_020890880.1 uncharacterized protein LOC9322891 isoform X1 [Arabidopsis lyrata subsp. lyrata]